MPSAPLHLFVLKGKGGRQTSRMQITTKTTYDMERERYMQDYLPADIEPSSDTAESDSDTRR